MIELFLVAQIIWTLNAGTVPICKDLGYPILDGCYDGINKIYISETTSRPKDFILYHEIGHSLFNKEYFEGKTKFKNEEIMAESFAMWIYNRKYNYNPKIKGEASKYFQKYCDKKCVKKIINIKVPNMVYPIEPFSVRI